MKTKSFALGLGGNLGDVRENIEVCVSMLKEHIFVSDLVVSSLYRTSPWGDVEGGDFLNAAVCGLWLGKDMELLYLCQCIESRFKTPVRKNGAARELDVDVLFLEGGLSCEELILPHPRMHLRKFVLVPLSEIWSKTVPGISETPADLLKRVPDISSIIFEGNLNTV